MRKGSGLGGGKGFDGDANGSEDGDGDRSLVALTHDQRMIELDREKYRLAGQVSELELEIGNLQSEISRLRSELGSSGSASNNNANNSNNGNNNNETSLKLEIYRNLGVEMVADDTGTFTKARVTSPPPRNEVHLIQFNDKYSASFYSERLWNIIT
ncbi:hypothetical protein GQ42DRAFT_149515 [Ramicandelaber brevisporus]|nr:hypothetical protein GQ42DRAFT_149515 [Ramicandelaber brevisporus]